MWAILKWKQYRIAWYRIFIKHTYVFLCVRSISFFREAKQYLRAIQYTHVPKNRTHKYDIYIEMLHEVTFRLFDYDFFSSSIFDGAETFHHDIKITHTTFKYVQLIITFVNFLFLSFEKLQPPFRYGILVEY